MATYILNGSESFPSHEDVARALAVVDDPLSVEALRQLEMWRDDDDTAELATEGIHTYLESGGAESISVPQRLGDLSLSEEPQRYIAEAA
jgi:hypothetical protein